MLGLRSRVSDVSAQPAGQIRARASAPLLLLSCRPTSDSSSQQTPPTHTPEARTQARATFLCARALPLPPNRISPSTCRPKPRFQERGGCLATAFTTLARTIKTVPQWTRPLPSFPSQLSPPKMSPPRCLSVWTRPK